MVDLDNGTFLGAGYFILALSDNDAVLFDIARQIDLFTNQNPSVDAFGTRYVATSVCCFVLCCIVVCNLDLEKEFTHLSCDQMSCHVATFARDPGPFVSCRVATFA